MPSVTMKKIDETRFGDTEEETLRYLISLKIILSADGLHPLEFQALSRGMRLMGVPEALAAVVDDYDVTRQRLEDHLPRKSTRQRSRMLIYDAIRLACADQEYSEQEAAAVAKAAEALGVDGFAVRALEGLVQMERVVEKMRKALLQAE
jgi:hypothetical protein